MKRGDIASDKFVLLREQAEQLLALESDDLPTRLPNEINALLLELQTHQIELELQNDDLRQTQEALNISRKKFSDLYDFAPIGYLTISASGLILEANLTSAELLGIERGRLIKQRFSAFIADEDQDIFFIFRKHLLQRKESQRCELRLRKNNGELFHSQLKSTLNAEVDGDSDQFRIVIIDISEQTKAEQLIKTLSQVVEQSPVSVVITDTDANIEYVNNAFQQVSGYSANEVIGRNPRFLQSGNTPPHHFSELWKNLNRGDAWQGVFHNRKKNGELYWEHVHIAPVLDSAGVIRHYLAVKQDITQHHEQEMKILHQAHYDHLTNLPNRFLALDRLSQLIIEAERNKDKVALLFLDLDDFKKVNDTLGHQIGDQLLIAVASRFRGTIRNSDTLGRFGGDEFIILIGGLETATDVLPVLENLLSESRKPYSIDGRELLITASMGIAIFPDDGDSSHKLLRKVDIAMYHSKAQGRNTYSFFTAAMNRDVERRLSLEEQMHGALRRKEFDVFYQPIIEIASGQTIGAEALLRWHNPKLGNISPEEFIPVAEQTGMIIDIGQFVLQQALTETANWQRDIFPQFRIAVNLSPRQFRDKNLIAMVEKAITQSQITFGSLELEVTEGVMLDDYTDVAGILPALRQLGVSISMDDFGTGFSSLSYLRTYPFDILKIDRSFIRDIGSDKKDRDLISAAVLMGKSLGMKLIAEGVETAEQLKYLKGIDCDYAQGYFFHKPMTAQDMLNWLKNCEG